MGMATVPWADDRSETSVRRRTLGKLVTTTDALRFGLLPGCCIEEFPGALDQPVVVERPDTDGSVSARGEKPRGARTGLAGIDDERGDGSRVAGQHDGVGEGPIRCGLLQIPDADRSVLAAGTQAGPVRRERQGLDATGVAGKPQVK